MRKLQQGFSLVELMVGSVISLIVAITVAGSAQFLETQKRIIVGTNGVLESLSLSYRGLSDDIKLSGSGVAKCSQIFYKVGGVTTTIIQPLQIKINATGSDEIVTFYGESTTGSAYSFTLDETTGDSFTTTYAGNLNNGSMGAVTNGSLVVLKQPRDSNGISPSCSIYALSNLSLVGSTTTVALNNTVNGSVWGSDSTTYPINSMVFGLTSVKNISIKVVNNVLQEVDSFRPTIVNQIADNIVYMKAYYGLVDGTFIKADASSGTDWSPAGITVENTKKIRSVRVFLVARSPILNKKNSSGKCDATDDDHKIIKSWDAGMYLDVSKLPDGQCYRYLSSDFIIPLRNKVLSDSIV